MSCLGQSEGRVEFGLCFYYGYGTLNMANFVAIERYFELLKESKIRGHLFEQQNYVPKE